MAGTVSITLVCDECGFTETSSRQIRPRVDRIWYKEKSHVVGVQPFSLIFKWWSSTPIIKSVLRCPNCTSDKKWGVGRYRKENCV